MPAQRLQAPQARPSKFRLVTRPTPLEALYVARVRSAKRKYTHNPDPTDPTPEEIAERCAEVQAGWTKAERARRAPWAIEQQQVRMKRMRYDGTEPIAKVREE